LAGISVRDWHKEDCVDKANLRASWSRYLIGAAIAAATVIALAPSIIAQAPAAPAAVSGPVKLTLADGSSASYRVREQLAGIDFPSDAVGTTPSVTGMVVINPDGSVDSSQSKLTIDLKTLKSDQDMRDGYIQKRTLETDKYPTAEFVPHALTGIPNPFPTKGQAGYKLTGDLTVHGTTSPVTWTGIVTFNNDGAAGRGMTDFTFATFGLMKPQLARLLSVDDKIQLEISFRFKRS
jgi:polyisoprenoid-binding protein YceI